jgi:hypothetical protein
MGLFAAMENGPILLDRPFGGGLHTKVNGPSRGSQIACGGDGQPTAGAQESRASAAGGRRQTGMGSNSGWEPPQISTAKADTGRDNGQENSTYEQRDTVHGDLIAG